ncbi:hypothetical protein C1H46_021622 [Malus baccata]|uniref:Uncharacterized protein n=1 Tax=Malus baccata TaxID=106549 RepID=A0A540M1X1_MALBA|nr:hypothetical protein C1H46_021622 [Malus baccata]
MALAEKELESQLTEAGNQLLEPPSSVPDLLDVLDISPNSSSNCWVFFFFSYCEVFASQLLSFCV